MNSPSKLTFSSAQSLVITQAPASVLTTRTTTYAATAYDGVGNVITTADIQWFIDTSIDATIHPQTGVVTAGCTPGTHSGAVTASFGSVSVTADLVIVAGGARPTSDPPQAPPRE